MSSKTPITPEPVSAKPKPHIPSTPVTPADHAYLGLVASLVTIVPLVGPHLVAVIQNPSQANWTALVISVIWLIITVGIIALIHYLVVKRDPTSLRFLLLGTMFLQEMTAGKSAIDPEMGTTLSALITNIDQALSGTPPEHPPTTAEGGKAMTPRIANRNLKLIPL